MGYRLVEIDFAQPLRPIALGADQNGCGIVARWHGRLVGFHLERCEPGATLSVAHLQRIADARFAQAVLAARVAEALPERSPEAADTTLSVVICTKDRAQRLARLLHSLHEAKRDSTFRSVEVIVVDNASTDQSTRDAAAGFGDVRYVLERRTGLNFARNAALAAATGQLIAYLDDDVVVDRCWLAGLAEAWRSRPDAGGFTGLVLPFRLDTEAQVHFEAIGGFGRGFARLEYRQVRFAKSLFPVGSGEIGAGCNMAFDRKLLVGIGGFDEALDTGAPLPGGGDLDIFYRVLRSGRTMVYEPRYAVYHEHRETIAQLRRQYWSWGLGMMAFLIKSRRSDPELKARHSGMVRWWFGDRSKALWKAILRGGMRDVRFVLAELWGGVVGLLGEYDRSLARVAAIREAAR